MSQTDATLHGPVATASRPARRRRIGSLEPHLYLIPVLLCLAFFAYNIGLTLYESTQYHVLAYPQLRRFVGLDNFARILTDPMTSLSFRQSLVWVLGTTL